MARIPGFYPGCPGSIPGQGTKISLQATVHRCCFSKITIKKKKSMGGGYQPKSNSESQTGGEFNFLGHQGFFSSPRCLKSPPKTCFLESGSRSRKGLSPSAPQVVLSPPHPALHRPLMMWGLPVLSRGLESLLWMAQPMPRVQHAQCTGQTRADPSPMGMPAGGPFKTY